MKHTTFGKTAGGNTLAMAVAVRVPPSSRAISPKESPGSMMLRKISRPSAAPLLMRIRPLTTAYSASPGSPWLQTISPAP